MSDEKDRPDDADETPPKPDEAEEPDPQDQEGRPGPDPERLKIEGDWKKAVRRVVRRERKERESGGGGS